MSGPSPIPPPPKPAAVTVAPPAGPLRGVGEQPPACRVATGVAPEDLHAVAQGDCTLLIDCGDHAVTEDTVARLIHLLPQGTPPSPDAQPTTGEEFPDPETLLLGLSLTTRGAYDHDVSAAVIGAMLRHGMIPADTVLRLRTALYEAISNALVHGNLELASPRRDDLSDFVMFGDAIANRLSDPDYASRRLAVSVCAPTDSIGGLRLHIRNDGPGFNPAALPPRERRKPDRAHGGWALILAGCDHAVFSPDGRTLTLYLPVFTP